MGAMSRRRVWELKILGIWEWSGFARKPRRLILLQEAFPRPQERGESIASYRAELGFEFAVPFDDGGFGNAELAADAGKAESADAEAAKFVFGVLVVHMFERSTPLAIDGGEI